jgi:putative endonuclease
LKGNRGENAAVKFLEKKKYKILERNFVAANCEIDVIAVDGNWIVFIEVKTRTNEAFGLPREAVNSVKQARIARAAAAYLQKKRLSGVPARFDVVEVTDVGIIHIENAFEL